MACTEWRPAQPQAALLPAPSRRQAARFNSSLRLSAAVKIKEPPSRWPRATGTPDRDHAAGHLGVAIFMTASEPRIHMTIIIHDGAPEHAQLTPETPEGRNLNPATR